MGEDKGRSGIGIWKAKQMKQELQKQRCKGRMGWGGCLTHIHGNQGRKHFKNVLSSRTPHPQKPLPLSHPSYASYQLPSSLASPEGSLWDISVSNSGFLSNWSFLHPPSSTQHMAFQQFRNVTETSGPLTLHLSPALSPPSLLSLPTGLVPGHHSEISLIPCFFPFIILTWQNLILNPKQLRTLITRYQESEKIPQNQADNSHFKISARLESWCKQTNWKTIYEVTREIWTWSG